MVVVPRLTLTYFTFGARAEPLRLAAAIGKIPFYHKVAQSKDWKAVKHEFPLRALPVLEIEWEDGRKELIVQSNAILRYFGKVGGLYPEDAVEAMRVDSLMDTMEEATGPIEITIQGAVERMIADEDWTKEQVLQIRHRIVTNEERGLPRYLSYFEKVLNDNGTGWLVGGKITIADVKLTRLVGWVKAGMLDGIPASLLDHYPSAKAHLARIEDLPEVKEWRANHPMPYTDFAFMM